MANYPGVRDFTAGNTLTADQLDEIWTALQSLFPVGYIAYMVRAATTVETFVNNCWLECNGVSVLRATYPDLNTVLSALSYPFGSVDGTHMTLPDLQGRTLVAMAASGHADVNGLGDSDGLTKASRTPKISVHSHSFSDTATTGNPSAQISVDGNTPNSGVALNAHTHDVTVSGTTGSAGAFSGNFLVAGTYFIKAVT
jgi:microcystin-dependent protein